MKAGRAAALAACVLACAACGSKQSVDSGGFTADERKAAQAALDRLQQTMIPKTVVGVSIQSAQAPRICSVLLQPGSPGLFKLFVAWKPSAAAYRFVPQTLLEATIGQAKVKDVQYHVTTFGGRVPVPASVEATLVRAVESKPAERCEALENGQLRLVAAN